jgi:hypothetical protein
MIAKWNHAAIATTATGITRAKAQTDQAKQ